MSAAAPKLPFVPFEEYLRREAESEQKHDYIDGRIIDLSNIPSDLGGIVGMAGGSEEHGTIAANLIGEVRARLKGKPCRIIDSTLRIGSLVRPKTHYPDATIACAPLEYDPGDSSHQTFLNPTVIFEVLSPSTEKYDRIEKFDHYTTLPSLREYVLIRQDRPEASVYSRHDDGTWTLRILHGLESTLPIKSAGIEVPFSELYDRVTFPPPDETNGAAVPAAR